MFKKSKLLIFLLLDSNDNEIFYYIYIYIWIQSVFVFLANKIFMWNKTFHISFIYNILLLFYKHFYRYYLNLVQKNLNSILKILIINQVFKLLKHKFNL